MKYKWKYFIAAALKFAHSFHTSSPILNRLHQYYGTKIALGCGIALSFGFVQAFEDEAIRNIRSLMNK
jgi:hypothetical protein